MKPIIVEIEQIPPDKSKSYPGDPEKFQPARYSYHDEQTKLIFKLLGKDVITVEDINSINSIPILFKFLGQPIPIGGELYWFEQYATWRDTEHNRYVGVRKDERGFIRGNEPVTGTNRTNIYDKLFLREWYKPEPVAKISDKDIKRGLQKMREARQKLAEELRDAR